ncbi:MAG: 4-vinyl reductase [Candidatus Caldarchaeum sp.]
MAQIHEGASDLKPEADSRILTANPQFDEIVTFYTGMTVMVSDETFSEGRAFLHALFKHRPLKELVSPRQSWSDGGWRIPVNIENLQELSITVNKLRRSLHPQILIHSYLPELLVKHGSDQVLKLLNFWQADVEQTGHVEFYLIPKKTFVDFERKLAALVDGAIEISVERVQNAIQQYFIPIRIAKDEYHLKPVSYTIEGGELIIKPAGEMTMDIGQLRLVAQEMASDQETILTIAQRNYRVHSLADFFMLKEMDGWKTSWLKQVFPDEFDRVLTKMAAYVREGVLNFGKTPFQGGEATDFTELEQRCVRRLKLLCSGEAVDVLNNVAELVAQKTSQPSDSGSLVGCLQELYARLYAFSLQAKMAKRGLEKTLEDALEDVAELKAKVRKLGQDAYAVEISNCPFCRGLQTQGPACENYLANMLKGLSTVLTGRGLACSEVECRASGGRKCVFQLKTVRQIRTET